MQTAQLVISSYDLSKIKKGFDTILSQAKSINVNVKGKPLPYKVKPSKDTPIIWGCEGLDVKRKSVFVSGSVNNLVKLIDIKIAHGVYVQLLPQKND